MITRLLAPLAGIALALAPAPAFAWGKTGHRVVGAIAQRYLTPRAAVGVKRILGSETLAEASNWPDFMRSDPSDFWQHTAGPWHYVTVPKGKMYVEASAPPEGDGVTALARFSATVRDPNANLADKQLALRFIVHIVGDLQQPLHAGNGTDKGGNEVKVTFDGKPTNLHAVWDSGLIDDEQLSFSEMASWLRDRITPADLKTWSTTDPTVWVAESAALRDRIYPSPGETNLSYRYVFDHKAQMELRLEQGGVRLAAYLNQLFAPAKRG
ncbi:S1/P1 Nuclease [Sphingomonas sp. AAP5]|uniref:S1/P1 nuclease n=1 Tax=Sphingomonas sp. AAP5 TaxID=1523415 RepID=UPI001056F0A1|nr:S1/P1 nuclease [Sphingomonas sp. AAP5]QBM76577.1 S1/P1 Nuclease [Sphingomonas sp. AAP5]